MADNPPTEPPIDRTASHLARNLASLRHTRGLTQAALAKAAAVPRSTIANLESGTGNPSLAVLVKVAQALAVPIDELLAAPTALLRRWSSADIAVKTAAAASPRAPSCPSRCPTR